MPQDTHVALTVDAVVIGYTKGRGLSCLLIQRKNPPFQGQWALPGGFVEAGESLERAVSRELREEAGVDIAYLEQLYTFGQPDRDPRGHTVSVAYFAVVRPDAFKLYASTDADDARWFYLDSLPELAFDHRSIIQMAEQRVRNKITYEPLGFELLGDKFPFSDLKDLYETLLGREIDPRNFKKKMMRLGILEELNERVKHPGSGRPARLYRFNEQAYFQRKNEKRSLDLEL